MEGIFASASRENVVATARFESIVPSTSSDRVVSLTTLQEVVSPLANDQIVATSPRDLIVASRSDDAVSIRGLFGRSVAHRTGFQIGSRCFVARPCLVAGGTRKTDQHQQRKHLPHLEHPPIN
ncbi:MAG: hypothetical protein AAEJ53_00975, partial [Myxococcota bacterium]